MSFNCFQIPRVLLCLRPFDLCPRRQTERLQEALLLKIHDNPEDADLRRQAEGLDWRGVIEQYSEHITKTDEAKTKGNFLRDKLRKGSTVAGVLHGLTEMIPEEKGLGVLKVGLAYILMVSPVILLRWVASKDVRNHQDAGCCLRSLDAEKNIHRHGNDTLRLARKSSRHLATFLCSSLTYMESGRRISMIQSCFVLSRISMPQCSSLSLTWRA